MTLRDKPSSSSADISRQTPTGEAPTFQKELKNLINRHSVENDSDTPDFILASFLVSMLQVFGATAKWRDEWYEPKPAVAEGAPPAPHQCPTCGSPRPDQHPWANEADGDVKICVDAWHRSGVASPAPPSTFPDHINRDGSGVWRRAPAPPSETPEQENPK